MQALIDHIDTHFAKYLVPVLTVLTALSALLGQVITEVGTSSSAGQAIGSIVAAVATLTAGLRYMRDRFDWKKAEAFGAMFDTVKGLNAAGLLHLITTLTSKDGSGQPDAHGLGEAGHPDGNTLRDA